MTAPGADRATLERFAAALVAARNLDAVPVETTHCALVPACLHGQPCVCEQKQAPRLSQPQLAQTDMIAAQQHAVRAMDALERALQRYTALNHADHALTRLRGRSALRMLADALTRIDVTNGAQFDE